MSRHYKPTGWLTTRTINRGDKEYSYPVYCYLDSEKRTRTKRVHRDRLAQVRKAITSRKPIKEVLAVINGEAELAIAS